ncbi:MAG: thioredoxin domain-containing protein, partial [Nitrososphaeraceae archaeon]
MYDQQIDRNSKKANKLINETSPYLLQHAYNPVDWYPWGKNALEKARAENKPIFLSIGYSSCHWCHVMAHESFEDEEIAKIMNENFVNIKVDREERADLDDVYQRVCQLAAGSGGWPLSVFLTPDQKPFYIGTYFPKISRYGMPGFMSIVKQLADTYLNNKKEILSATSEFMHALSGSAEDVSFSRSVGVEPERSVLDEAAVSLLHFGDPTYGGFGQAPKFPNPSNLMFMLRYYELSKISKFKDFVVFTADKMVSGGIHDHLGGGFSRYSTDQKWLVPHFEKMLYDNALLIQLFSEVYQVSQDEKYLEVLHKSIRYVLEEMTSPEGCFYSAEDADSEGEEGKYYLWTKREISEILNNKTDADVFCLY